VSRLGAMLWLRRHGWETPMIDYVRDGARDVIGNRSPSFVREADLSDSSDAESGCRRSDDHACGVLRPQELVSSNGV